MTDKNKPATSSPGNKPVFMPGDEATGDLTIQTLLENTPFPMGIFVGQDMHILLANPDMLAIWGKGSDVVGKPYADVLPELAELPFYDQIRAVVSTGVPFQARNQRIDLLIDGVRQPTYFNYNLTPLYGHNGQLYGALNTVIDVTDLTLAKQQVEKAEVALRGAIELAELGTWELDVPAGQVTFSDRIKAWCGFPESVSDNVTVYDAIQEQDRERIKNAIRQVLQAPGGPLFDEEYLLINQQTGDQRIIHAQGIPYFNEQGQPQKLVGTAQDVTAHRRLQQQLERQVVERTRQLQASIKDLRRSNENLQQFAYIASHDLQEPLRKIQSFGNLLESQFADQLGEGVDYLHRMQGAAARMSVLIKDLLTFSRISTRQDATESIDLNAVVQAASLDLDVLITETGANIEISQLPTVSGDRSQLKQLFQNLLSNALKFRRPDSSPVIRIRAQDLPASALPPAVQPTRPAEHYHQIDVVDNGIGFDQKYVDRIFQVFQRLHGRNEFAGTGIGLAICEKVVANHGGGITATSTPGEGATFSLFFPA